jgi:threonine dehydrogenase-like Zn-dependent dehydrogenase
MKVVDVPEPEEPRAGEVVLRPEAVGLCGSDFHYFLGDIGTMKDPSVLYPRIMGHEFSAIVEAVGPESPTDVRSGERVAVWPLTACHDCYPCRVGRHNVCANINLIGVHRDGALQELLRVPAAQVFPVGDQDAAVAAFIEPVSIAVRTIVRGRVSAGEKVVVLGAGPIGQAVALAATDRGASVLLVDRLAERLERGRASGADLLAVEPGDRWLAEAREWAGSEGPEVVVEATGVPELVRSAMEIVGHGGRVVVVGLSSDDAPLRVGDLPFRELDLLGVSCCGADEFAEAVQLVGCRRDVVAPLVTHQFSLEEAPQAIEYAIRHPVEAMKVVVRVDAR